MRLFSRRIADDVHMHSLRLLVPDVETYRGGRRVAADIPGDVHGIGASLLHRLCQLQEEPVVVLAGERVVGIHRLRLAPHLQRLCRLERLVVGRADLPECCLLRLCGLQSFAEHHERVVAL